MPLSAFQLGYHALGGLAKTATFDLTEASSGFLWRDNLVGTAHPKMALDANNSLHLYGATGTAANIVLNGADGRISLSGIGSGIYSGGNAVFSLDSSGNVVFGTGRSLNISNITPSTSSATGAFTVAGGFGAGMDSYFNGVRVGRGGGNNSENIVVGSQAALGSNTVGYNNIAIGLSALKDNTIGSHNLAIGTRAMEWNLEGQANIAVGMETLRRNTTGHRNIAVGLNALTSNTTGDSNVAVGFLSMEKNTIGVYNAALGSGSMQDNTEGTGNTALGFAALGGNTTGHSNTTIGMVSMLRNTTGFGNTSVGNHAANHLNGGNRNVMLGAGAGSGQMDGTTPLLTPENSIYIGANSLGHSEEDYNTIVIGTDAISQGANTTVIGNTSTTRTKLFGKLDTAKVEITAGVPGDDALVVEGNTTLSGKVTISAPQGDISMGIYE